MVLRGKRKASVDLPCESATSNVKKNENLNTKSLKKKVLVYPSPRKLRSRQSVDNSSIINNNIKGRDSMQSETMTSNEDQPKNVVGKKRKPKINKDDNSKRSKTSIYQKNSNDSAVSDVIFKKAKISMCTLEPEEDVEGRSEKDCEVKRILVSKKLKKTSKKLVVKSKQVSKSALPESSDTVDILLFSDSDSDADFEDVIEDVSAKKTELSKECIKNNNADTVKGRDLKSHVPILSSTKAKQKKVCTINDYSKEIDVTSILLKMEGVEEGPSTSSTKKRSKGKNTRQSKLSSSNLETLSDSSDEEDWEEVEDDSYTMISQIPKEPIEITLDAPQLIKKKKKKKFDWIAYYQGLVRKFHRTVQFNIHKVQLLCLLAHGMQQSNILNAEHLSALACSLLPEKKTLNHQSCTVRHLQTFVKWFGEKFLLKDVEEEEKYALINLHELQKGISEQNVKSVRALVAIFVIFLRMMTFDTRLTISVHPVPVKHQSEEKTKLADKKTPEKDVESSKTSHKSSGKKKGRETKSKQPETKTTKCKYFKNQELKTHNISKVKQSEGDACSSAGESSGVDRKDSSYSSKVSKQMKEFTDTMDCGGDNSKKGKSNKGRRSLRTSLQVTNYADKDNSESGFDDEYIPSHNIDSGDNEKEAGLKEKINTENRSGNEFVEETKTFRTSSSKKVKNEAQNVTLIPKHTGYNSWIEVYLQKEKRWICIDPVHNIIDKPFVVEKEIFHPVHYVFAFSTDQSVKDVTARYASNWASHTRKLRVDADWLAQTLEPYRSSNTHLDQADDDNIKDQLLQMPLPVTVSGFKDHPLYALKRHLLKFEAIYPNEAIPVGFIKGEPIYARECIHTLHSRENWIREGRSVKLEENAYKMVKSRSFRKIKLDPDALDLEVFGFWQTEDYVPPPVVDGKIPRNAYGNLELYQSWMLPDGTVHVKLPGLARVAKKLGVDCVPAMLGWDKQCTYPKPILDGWIVCVEHEESLELAWEEDQLIQQQKEVDKRQKRILGNWKLLTRSLLIGDRLKKKFDLEVPEESEPKTKGTKNADDTKHSWPRNRQKEKKTTTKKKPTHFTVETM